MKTFLTTELLFWSASSLNELRKIVRAIIENVIIALMRDNKSNNR